MFIFIYMICLYSCMIKFIFNIDRTFAKLFLLFYHKLAIFIHWYCTHKIFLICFLMKTLFAYRYIMLILMIPFVHDSLMNNYYFKRVDISLQEKMRKYIIAFKVFNDSLKNFLYWVLEFNLYFWKLLLTLWFIICKIVKCLQTLDITILILSSVYGFIDHSSLFMALLTRKHFRPIFFKIWSICFRILEKSWIDVT